jgi:hypothetical protein
VSEVSEYLIIIIIIITTTTTTIRSWRTGVRVPAEAGISFFRHRIQTSSGAHPASYQMGTGGSYTGGKMAGA